MLEGVLKAKTGVEEGERAKVSILGMLEGVLKDNRPRSNFDLGAGFQSLVCWRGC